MSQPAHRAIIEPSKPLLASDDVNPFVVMSSFCKENSFLVKRLSFPVDKRHPQAAIATRESYL